MTSNSVIQQPQSSSYQPSVPISLYRELAAELQSTQAKLTALQVHNEQLAKQNQVLLQEFEAIAQSRQQMQEIVAQTGQKLQEAIAQSSQSAFRVLDIVGKSKPAVVQPVQTQQIQIHMQVPAQTLGQRMQEVVARASTPPPMPQTQPTDTVVSLPFQPQPKPAPVKKLVTHQEEPVGLAKPESDQAAGGLTGWWLALTILAIVTTSFGAGYFLMRPFAK